MFNFKLARSLGWASLAVGATEIGATRWLQQHMGVKGHDLLLRLCGAREIATGMAILQNPGVTSSLAAGLWGRVVGDALDLALLGAAKTETDNPEGLATVAAVVFAITVTDVIVASSVQAEISKGKAISKAAKSRVIPTQAMPNGRPSLIAAAVQ